MAMKKKNLLALTMAACLGLSCLTGCELVTTDNQRDMAQVVADIDITKSTEFAEGGAYAKYASAVGTETVVKRELITYFVNVGYMYVQSYGYTYSQAFDLIVTSLVNQKIIGQYAKAYYLKLSETSADYNYSLADYEAYVNAAEDKDVAAYRYFLTDDEYGKAVYTLNQSINSSIDSYEKEYLKEESTSSSTTARTLPTGAETEEEDYYDKDYAIYTGKNALSSCGTYEAVENSTPSTRKKAYNRFLLSLQNNYLYSKEEQGLPMEELSYYKTELARQLSSALINKLADTIEDEAAKNFTESYVTARYNELLAGQQNSFNASSSNFETALDSMSDSSFVLYAPTGGYGFVINILLPFSTTQSFLLSGYQADTSLTNDERYEKRGALLKNVLATDQRETWFTGDEDYSYETTDYYGASGTSGYLFFENSLTDSDRYESMKNYFGKYAYNGTVEKDEDGEYVLTPDKISIDGFIEDLEGYVSYATGKTPRVLLDKQDDYYTRSYLDEKGEVDYSKFVYYAGKFDLGFNPNEVFLEGTDAYNAFSAVNELSFAYNTDTAGLNSYLGYAISAYNTDFVKEFEYAAKYAVSQGVGSYVVSPSDYGWHIMYCTYVFEEGEVYSFNYADIEKEGTFSYYFYEALKSSTSGTATNSWQTRVINTFNNDTCVKKHESRYQDLKDLD